MLAKKAYIKPYVDKKADTDFGIEGCEHLFRLWRDPSRQTVFTLLNTITMKPDELEALDDSAKRELDEAFWRAVSEVIIDCDIEGLDFSTTEKARESFDSPHISWGILYDVLFAYVSWLLTENDNIRKKISPPKRA
jgi:hypothetical protein